MPERYRADGQQLTLAVPGGGRRGQPPTNPAFSLLSCPHPPNPLPLRGRGRFLVYFAGGSAPGTPSIRPTAAFTDLAEQVLNGGLPFWLLTNPAFHLLSCPHPPPSRREGGNQGYCMQGASPLASPGLDGARHYIACGKPVLSASNGALAPAGAAGTRVVKSRHSAGCLFGKDCKCRERSNAGVPGAKPPAK